MLSRKKQRRDVLKSIWAWWDKPYTYFLEYGACFVVDERNASLSLIEITQYCYICKLSHRFSRLGHCTFQGNVTVAKNKCWPFGGKVHGGSRASHDNELSRNFAVPVVIVFFFFVFFFFVFSKWNLPQKMRFSSLATEEIAKIITDKDSDNTRRATAVATLVEFAKKETERGIEWTSNCILRKC